MHAYFFMHMYPGAINQSCDYIGRCDFNFDRGAIS